jgi:hypothetical protein
MITKEIVDAGFTKVFPVLVLTDENNPDVQVMINRDDYTDLRLNEGMSDQDIIRFSIEGVI